MSNLFCLVCNKSFPEAELSGHVISIHFGFLPFACTSCDFTAAQESEVLQHADEEGHIPFVINRSSTKPYLTLLSKFIVGHGKVFSASKDFAGILTGLTSHIAADLSQLDGPKTGAQLGAGHDSETSSENSVSTPRSTLVSNLIPDADTCLSSADGSSSLPQNLPLSMDTSKSNGSIELLISQCESATVDHRDNSTSDIVLPVPDVAVTCCALCPSNEAFPADQRESHVLKHLNPNGTASNATSDNPAEYFNVLAKMWQLCFPDLVSNINFGRRTTADLILQRTDTRLLAASMLNEATLPLFVEPEQPQKRPSPPHTHPTPAPLASDRLIEHRSPQSSPAPTLADRTPSPQVNFADPLLATEPDTHSSPHSNSGYQMRNLSDVVAVKREHLAQQGSAAAACAPENACGGIDGVRCGLCPEDPSRYWPLEKEAHVVQHVEKSGLSPASNSSVFFDVVSRFQQICFPADLRQVCEANQDQSNAVNATIHSDQVRQLLRQENPSPASEGHENVAGDFEQPSEGNELSVFLGKAILSDVTGAASPLVPEVGMFGQEVEDKEDQQAMSTPIMSHNHRIVRRSDVCAVCGEILASPKTDRTPNEQKALFHAKRHHVWQNHAPALPYRCGSCENAGFLGKRELQRHRKNHHPDLPIGELDGRSAEEKAEDFALFDKCFPFEKITDGSSQNIHQDIHAAANADPNEDPNAEDVCGRSALVTSMPSNGGNSYPAVSLKRKVSAVDSVGGVFVKAKQPSDSGQGKTMSTKVLASTQVKRPFGPSRIPTWSAGAVSFATARQPPRQVSASSASTVTTVLSRKGDDASDADSTDETWPENPFNIQAGQLVWSKYAQCPWWPATVFALYPLEVSPLERSVCVLFIESSKAKVQEHGLVNITTDVEPFISSFAKRYNRRRKCLDYQKSCAKAIRQSLTTSADIQPDYFMAHVSEQCLRQLKSFAGSLTDVEARHDSVLRRQQAAAAPSDEKKRNHDGVTTAKPTEKAEQSEVSAKRTKVAASEPSEVELKVRAAKQCKKLPVNVEGAQIRRPNPAHDSASFRSPNQTMGGPHARAAKPIGKLKAYRSSTCQLCSVSVTRDLRRHALRKHFSCLVYECSKCGFGRKAERSKVVGHMRAMHPRDTSVRLIDRSARLAIKIQQCLNSCFPDRGLSALLVKGMQRRENESTPLRKEATIAADLAHFDQPCTSGYAAIRVDDHYDEAELEDSYRESDIEEDNLAIIEKELLRESSSVHAVAVASRGAPVKAEGIHD